MIPRVEDEKTQELDLESIKSNEEERMSVHV